MSTKPLFEQTPRPALLPMREVERRHITEVLAATNGNRTEAARILGFDRKTLYRKLLRYNIRSVEGLESAEKSH